MDDGRAHPRPRVSDAILEQIDRDMDEAFMWNVTRDREIRRVLKHLRETKPNASTLEREQIIQEVTAKYRMLVSMARARRANECVM